MREIKFRGKRLDNGEWVYGNLITKCAGNNEKARCAIDISMRFEADGWVSVYIHEVDPATVGQFTGLCDKNGKEIYEGDVLFEDGEAIGDVRFDLGAYRIFWIGNYRYREQLLAAINTQFYVGGNIHDNPELLANG